LRQETRDGKYLVYQHFNAETGADISYVKLQPGGDPREPVTFLSTAANERVSKLSPDGRFLAYVSNESGSNEIYVRPFPDGAGKRLFESADLRHSLAAAQYDVSADGQRFVTIAPVQQDEWAPPKIRIVENWYEEFRDRERD
jgi:Tol biopolymer transport system component